MPSSETGLSVSSVDNIPTKGRHISRAAPLFLKVLMVLILFCPMLFAALDVDACWRYAGKSATGQVVDDVRLSVGSSGYGVDAGGVPHVVLIEHFFTHRTLDDLLGVSSDGLGMCH